MFKMSRQPRTNATLLPFMTRHRAPFTCLKIGAESHRQINQSLCMRWSTIFRISPGSNSNVQLQGKKPLISRKISGWRVSGRVLENEFDVDMFTVVISSACM